MKKYFSLLLIIVLFALLSAGCQKPASKDAEKSEPIKEGKQEQQAKSIKSSTLEYDQEAQTSDTFNDPNGPFYHKVYKATSSDGLNFKRESKLVLDTASVPDAVKMPDGRIIVYAVDGAKRSISGILVAISKDNGKTFKEGSLQMQADDYTGSADPQAVLLPNGKVRLFYVVFPAKKPPLDSKGVPIPTGDKIKIKSALSDDGINFVEEDGVRYETTDIVTDPDVIKIGSKWFMYLAKGQELIATSSTDGNTFKLEKSIRQQGSVSKTVAVGNGKYRQFFCKDGIGSAVTTDGLNFVDDPGSRLQGQGSEIICDPTPVQIGNTWLLFFKSAPPHKPMQ